MDTETYPDPAVRRFLQTHLVPVKVCLEEPSQRSAFANYQVIWTPTVAFVDRRGACHYQAPGYLPPGPFLNLLRIGLARCLLAWSRYQEAQTHLEEAARADHALAPEALYWLGMAYYLPVRQRSALMRAWEQLRSRYPQSIWAARVPPDQEVSEG